MCLEASVVGPLFHKMQHFPHKTLRIPRRKGVKNHRRAIYIYIYTPAYPAAWGGVYKLPALGVLPAGSPKSSAAYLPQGRFRHGRAPGEERELELRRITPAARPPPQRAHRITPRRKTPQTGRSGTRLAARSHIANQHRMSSTIRGRSDDNNCNCNWP